MTTMRTEVYDAFVSAGVPDDKARKAAEALSGHERRFDKLESAMDLRFASLERNIDARFANVDARFATVDTRFARIDGELALLKWMIGFELALTLGVLFLLLKH